MSLRSMLLILFCVVINLINFFFFIIFLRKLGKIIRVIPPSDEVIANEENRNVSFGLDPALYKYEVQQIEPVTADSTEIMGHEKITRSKSILTKDRIRLFLKQHIVSVKRFHPMILKDESIEKYGIDNVDWEDIFAGPDPNFDQETVIVKTINNKDKKKLVSELKKKSKDQMSDSKSSKKKHSKEKPRELTQEEKQRQKEELRQLRLEQKKLEKEKLKEQKKQHEEQMKEWNAKRDDLACDDLQPLPKPTPIDCDIPIEFFEDVIAISEFFHNFHQLFDDLEDVFPTGITFDLIKQAILDRDDDSQLIDIIQLLLENIFALQQEYEKTAVNNVKEDENEKDDKDKDRDDKDKDKDGDEEMNDEDDDDDFILKNAMKNANNVTNLIYQHYGCPLTQVAIDSQNLIEVLKFHLTSSGSGSNSRAKNRGGFAPREDPCLWFVINNAELIKKFDNPKFMLYDLNPNERLSIIHALIDQTLTYESFRNEIDDAFIQIANLRRQLRDLQANLSKWIKENNVKKTTTKKDSSETNDPDSTEIIEVSQEQIDDFKREKAKKEEETQLKCMEIRSEIRKYQSRYKLEPIGVDRAFRRYYIFESLPGLFVEHNDYDNGMCLTEPTPDKSSKPRSLDEISNSITKRNGYSIKKARICGDDSSVNSDKENDVSSSSMDTDKPQIKNGLDMNQDEKLSVYDRCTGNTTTCYVHGMNNFHSNEKVRWSFYHTPEQLDALISNLNNRGHRESELQSVLIQDKQAICDILLECQPHKLNKIISQPKIPRQNNHFDFMMCDVMLKKLQRYKDSGLFYKVPSKRFVSIKLTIIKCLSGLIIEFLF